MRNELTILSLGLAHVSFFFLTVITLACPQSPASLLQFRQGEPFKIALFADLHFGEDAWTDWGPQQDVNSVRVMSTVLSHENPDFVIYLGDVITANNIPIANASLYWHQAISPTKARGIPWASVYGNHDDAPFEWPFEWFSPPGVPRLRCPSTYTSPLGDEECSFQGTSRLQLTKKEIEKNPLSHSKSGPRELWPSVSNYVLSIASSNDPKSPLIYLYFLDSGGGSYPEVISSAQVEWFRRKSAKLNPSLRAAEMVFWHVPSKAYEDVAPLFINNTCVGSINLERVAPQQAELGIMNVLLERSSVKAVFVGHNHGLDWCCPYGSMWLCYARHTGYGGYGNWARGARIVEINENPFSIKSWISMEDGSVHSEILLSS